MTVLRIDNEQTRQEIEQLSAKSSACIKFVQDGAGNWIVGLEVLDDPNFENVRDLLLTGERVEYVPLPEIEI